VATREDKIKAIVDDIMEKLPEPFNMSEIMGKVEERTPYVVVAFQVKNMTQHYFNDKFEFLSGN
jgi:dynein heavy chain